LDDNRKPCPVPGLLLETEEERQAFEEGQNRYMIYKSRKKK
jgi:hypothetical protein